MATFACPECNHQQTVSDEHIGRRTKCPKCSKAGTVRSSTELVVADQLGLEPAGPTTVLRQSGGPIRTPLTRTIVLNEESSLEREFITIIDNAIPARLTSCIGISTVYERETDYSATQYAYFSSYAVKAFEEIRAFKTRFLTFNIWGRHVETLTATEIADVSRGGVDLEIKPQSF